MISKSAAALLLCASCAAQAATLDVTLQHPDDPTLIATRVEIGTCNAGQFGVPLGAMVIPHPRTMASFTGILMRPVCVRAVWINPEGESQPVTLAAAPDAPSQFVMQSQTLVIQP